MAALTDAQVGRDNDKCEQIESHRADGVVEGLGGRMYRVNEVEDAQARIFAKEQNHRVKAHNG